MCLYLNVNNVCLACIVICYMKNIVLNFYYIKSFTALFYPKYKYCKQIPLLNTK